MIVFLVLSSAGFIASVVVQASSFSVTAPVGMRNAWPLHIGILIVFLPMALVQQRLRRSGVEAGAKDESPDEEHLTLTHPSFHVKTTFPLCPLRIASKPFWNCS